MYGIRQCNRIFLSGEIGAFFTEIYFQISVVILNSNLHYQIFKFVIDNSDISLNCLQHIQKRRIFDAKVTCHQPICLLLHAILSGVGVAQLGRFSPKWESTLPFGRKFLQIVFILKVFSHLGEFILRIEQI